MATRRERDNGILRLRALRGSFSFSVPTVVRFGAGVSDDVASALPRGTRRVALVRGAKGLAAETVRAMLEQAGIYCVDVTCAREPSVASVNSAVEAVKGEGPQAVVAIGGGSVIDTGKALAFCLGHDLTLSSDISEVPDSLLSRSGPVPCIALPTTAGTGAEVTANSVLDIPELQAKVSLRGKALFPTAALVDPNLLKTAPASVLLSSGLDAVVQTIEAYTSCAATPFSDALTEPNITRGMEALQLIVAGDAPDSAWHDMAWVSVSSGVALANGGLGAAHGIASVLGGRYAAPHGALCGRLLVPVLQKNLRNASPDTTVAMRLLECVTQISEAFPSERNQDVLSGLEAWLDRRALPRLREFGIELSNIPTIADASCSASSSKKNPVALTQADYEEILRDAY